MKEFEIPVYAATNHICAPRITPVLAPLDDPNLWQRTPTVDGKTYTYVGFRIARNSGESWEDYVARANLRVTTKQNKILAALRDSVCPGKLVTVRDNNRVAVRTEATHKDIAQVLDTSAWRIRELIPVEHRAHTEAVRLALEKARQLGHESVVQKCESWLRIYDMFVVCPKCQGGGMYRLVFTSRYVSSDDEVSTSRNDSEEICAQCNGTGAQQDADLIRELVD